MRAMARSVEIVTILLALVGCTQSQEGVSDDGVAASANGHRTSAEAPAKGMPAANGVERSDSERGGLQPTGEETTMTHRSMESAILAGGCFWGMEDLIRKIDGVIETEVGYCGGENADATYRNHPGHAEAVRVVFDPEKISFEHLLVNWFFRMHDPTTRDRQGNDVGASYRSTIFYVDEDQKQIAEEAIRSVEAARRWPRPIVTTVEPVRNWSRAEPEHQDYLVRSPGGYTCHFLRNWEEIPTGAKK